MSVLVGITGIHILALCALLPYSFAWWGIPLVLLGNFVFGSLGINLGFHRMLTHKSVSFPYLLERLWILLGVCCLEGSPLWWASIHRIHHKHSDGELDPHSPSNSFFWSHMQWIYSTDKRQYSLELYETYGYDLVRKPFILWLHRRNRWAKIYVAHAIIIAIVGYLVGLISMDTTEAAFRFSVQVVLWGVFFRTVYVWHVTWLVNSAAHRWGYRNFNTADQSRNNPLVALLTNGEGWHNNHHANPRACSHGNAWWELDLTFMAVRLMQHLGLASEVISIRRRT